MISAILFYISLPLLLLISILPFRLLFIISDLLFPVIYYVVGYRKKVVFENLRNSFPEKTEEERVYIAKKFYRHFIDIIMEVLKMRTVSPKVLSKRIRYSNPEVLQEIYDRKLGVMGISAHFNNWEWTLGCSDQGPHDAVVVYKPLHNKHYDRFMKKSRERHGVKMIPMNETLREILKDQREGNLVLYGLISDQSPAWKTAQYWTPFLNQLTGVLTGAEKLAARTGLVPVYFAMRKIKRGRYIIDLIPLDDDYGHENEFPVTEKFFRIMEKIIQGKPEYWLWTHRRWKETPRKLAEMENS